MIGNDLNLITLFLLMMVLRYRRFSDFQRGILSAVLLKLNLIYFTTIDKRVQQHE